MSQRVTRGVLSAIAFGLVLTLWAAPASAQVAVTTYYAPAVVAPQPVVTYVPERRGLLFPRIVYRPVVTYPVVAPAAVPAPVTTYYAPAAVAAPVTTYYAPAPVTTYYAPVVPAAPAASCCGN